MVAALAITAAVVLGVLFMYLLQMQSVRSTIDGQLRIYATQIEQSAVEGTLPRILPSSSLDADAEAQVLAADGHVLAATRTLAGLPAVYALGPTSDAPVRLKAADGVIPTEIRVIAVRVTVGARPVTVITGTSTDLLRQVDDAFVRHLLLGLPVILLLSAGAVWLVVGRALRPVEKIRRAAGDITSAGLSQRVPESGTHDEIGHLAETMNAVLDRLEESSIRQRRFVADASHELRSPLAAIRTALEVGLAHPDQAPWPIIAERAARQSVRLEQLLQQLLQLAKADEQMVISPRLTVSVGQLLRDLCSDLPAAPVVVRLDLDAVDSLDTLGSAPDLARMIGNVVDNALRYAVATVHLRGSTTGRHIVIDITDDGPGIPADERERIFDRFVRLDGSRARSTGNSGLGLAIARQIADAHHGDIRVTDSPGGGAWLVIRLPAAPGTSEQNASGRASVDLGTGEPSAVAAPWDVVSRTGAGRRW